MPEPSSRAASLLRSRREKKVTPLSRYSYCQPHWKPVTLMVSSVLVVSSIATSVFAAGTAMTTRITTGIAVQMISTRVLCTSVVSATAPLDFRNLTID